MKRLILAGLVCATAFGAALSTPKVQADPPNCAVVLCMVCPDGYVLSPTPGNCCRCVPA
ncbi:MAG TPA: hypothetical protein VMW27_07185 [Thermoanaerobaculia bacterium]|nr:hypothetical protein [Thermoanaerobaculia bacterium]